MGRRIIDAMWDRKNLNNLNSNFEELFLNMGDHISLIRNLVGSTENVMPVPPNGEYMKTYANSINHPYFSDLLGSNTEPHLTVNNDTSVNINSGGYFFYIMKAVQELAPSKKMSFIVYTTKNNINFKLEYIFYDANGAIIGSTNSVTETVKNVYLIEGLQIPNNTATISLRLDNRTGTGTVEVKKLIIVASDKFGLFNFDAQDIELSLNNDLNDVKKEIMEVKNKDITIPYKQPSNFSLTNHILNNKITTDGKGGFDVDLDLTTFKGTKGKTYFVSGSGSNSNNGLSPSSPFADLYTAMNKSDVGTIMVDGNYIYRRPTAGLMIKNPTGDINIVGYNGRPKFFLSDPLKFTKTETFENVYQASRSGVGRVINNKILDDNGDYLEFKKVGSISEVNETPNSWYTESSIVYINQNNGVVIDSEIEALLVVDMFRFSGNFNVYLENIELIGGLRTIRFETSTGKLIANKVKASYSTGTSGNILEMVGGNYCISKDCEFSKGIMDGFNYHKGASNEIPYFVEINCIGRDNGIEKGTAGKKSNNGSTSHDGIKGIRVNGIYARNDGGNVADVNIGTETLNLGVISFESYQESDFLTTTGAIQFLDSCEGFGSTYSIQSVNAEDKVYIRRGQFQNKVITGTEIIY